MNRNPNGRTFAVSEIRDLTEYYDPDDSLCESSETAASHSEADTPDASLCEASEATVHELSLPTIPAESSPTSVSDETDDHEH